MFLESSFRILAMSALQDPDLAFASRPDAYAWVNSHRDDPIRKDFRSDKENSTDHYAHPSRKPIFTPLVFSFKTSSSSSLMCLCQFVLEAVRKFADQDVCGYNSSVAPFLGKWILGSAFTNIVQSMSTRSAQTSLSAYFALFALLCVALGAFIVFSMFVFRRRSVACDNVGISQVGTAVRRCENECVLPSPPVASRGMSYLGPPVSPGRESQLSRPKSQGKNPSLSFTSGKALASVPILSAEAVPQASMNKVEYFNLGSDTSSIGNCSSKETMASF